MQKSISLNDIAIASVKVNYYRIHFWYISLDKTIKLLKNAELSKKVDCYETKKHLYHVWRMSKVFKPFDNIEIKNHKFHHPLNLVLIEVADVVKISVAPSGEKRL